MLKSCQLEKTKTAQKDIFIFSNTVNSLSLFLNVLSFFSINDIHKKIKYLPGVLKKNFFKDFWERLDYIFKTIFLILKSNVYSRHLKKEISILIKAYGKNNVVQKSN